MSDFGSIICIKSKNLIRKTAQRFGIEVTRIKKPPSNEDYYNRFPNDSLREKRFYNVGAGLFQHPYWTNLDHESEHYAISQIHPFVEYDLLKKEPLPIEDNTAEIIYSSHVLEHVGDDAARNLLKESYRALKPDGCVRLTMPDSKLFYDAYHRKDFDFWYWWKYYSIKGNWEHIYNCPLDKASIEQLFLVSLASQLSKISIDNSPVKKYNDHEIAELVDSQTMTEMMNFFSEQCVYNPKHPGNHMNYWTSEKLVSFLQDAGFTVCYKSGFGQSRLPPLRDTSLFDNTHPRISLYIEGFKED